MDSTTLVTFLYQAPRHASRVELLGSWDNFSKTYPMQRDKSVSSRNWKGCHSFSNIVCDGDLVTMDGSSRDGGLQMGGTYWYYYRLDDDVECHDPTVSSTRGCPFLPGQEVNVLEVPVQADPIVCGSTVSLLDVFTLDPGAKFASPKKSTTPSRPSSPVFSNSPIKSALQRASSLRQNLFSTIPKFSLARTRSLPNRKCLTGGSDSIPKSLNQAIRPHTENDVADLRDEWAAITNVISNEADLSHLVQDTPYNKVGVPDGLRSHPTFEDADLGINFLNLDDTSSVYSGYASSINGMTGEETESNAIRPNGCPTSRSNRTSGVFSLLSDSAIGSPLSTNRHSYNHALPQTPSLPTFDSFVLQPLQFEHILSSNASTNGQLPTVYEQFGPYLQPEKAHSSAITLRQSITPLKDLNHTAKLSPFEKLDLVESWRNGESPSTVPEAEPSALQELINDLGYLSSMIA